MTGNNKTDDHGDHGDHDGITGDTGAAAGKVRPQGASSGASDVLLPSAGGATRHGNADSGAATAAGDDPGGTSRRGQDSARAGRRDGAGPAGRGTSAAEGADGTTGRGPGFGGGRRRIITFTALAVAAALVAGGAACARGGGPGGSGAPAGSGGPDAAGRSAALPPPGEGRTEPDAIPDRSAFLDPPSGAKYFGIAAPDAPWKSSVLSGIGRDAGGTVPDMVEYFVNWTRGFDPAPVRAAYAQHALPVITWEPWAGSAKGTRQPGYALATIISGRHDAYITSFARAVARNRWPVALRFGHEMNGHWYPWAEPNGVNRPGQFAAAWKHVHDIFRTVGADNVIWIWAPNTLRGADPVSLRSLYPGDAYVDWIGMSAYDVTEDTPARLLEPTLDRIREFTGRPLLITETGAQPGARQARWISALFPWLRSRPDVIGFVWFQYTRAQGGGADWTFTSSQASRDAFRTGVGTLRLVRTPGGHRA